MKHYLIFPLLFLAFIGPAGPLSAQERQQAENSLLPEIDPQSIEIRSEFKARFPGLRRQPILGFNPTPRIYQVDPDRMPFMETREQVVANIPVSSLSRPQPPRYYSLYNPEKINFFGRFGYGNFVSPETHLWGVKRLGGKSYIGGDLDYLSSEGHLEGEQGAFRLFNMNGEFSTKLGPGTRLDAATGFDNSFNQMFDTGPAPDGYLKNYEGYHLNAALHHFSNSISGWEAEASIRRFNASLENPEIPADAPDLTGAAEEVVYNVSAVRQWAGAQVNEVFTAKIGIRGGSFDNSEFSGSWLTGQAGVKYERLFNYSTRLTLNGRVYYGKDSYNSKIYLGPSVTVEHPLYDLLTVRVKAEAAPLFKTVKQLHTANRFLNVSNDLQHSYRFNSLAELELNYSKVGSLTMGIQYESINDYPVFVRNALFTPGGSLGTLFYTTDYSDVYYLRAYAAASHEILAHRFWLSAKAYVQSPQIKGGGQIPLEEEFGVEAGFSLRPFERMTIEGWANYVGPREAFNEELGGFFLLGAQADVRITEHVGVYVKLKNLLDQEYQLWQGYTERPFQVFGGITVKL